jgi:glycosyltransferase involved in cell wall biosynthesis
MYTGGIDFRKNIEGLIRAYSLLPKHLRLNLNLAIICSIQPSDKEELESLAFKHGLDKGEVIFTGFVSDGDLRLLYNICTLFVP